ncbi:hypothetical protein EYF80_052080 [Liparis tanakae]|uniref:Uncharacterized protein n=1 Tax=Liparis tanakae TaxID=230148 RepID=A0A4Z2FBI6_9TELE|nr:hypothetical protein EYF80_052080 [Liparis tanakae]
MTVGKSAVREQAVQSGSERMDVTLIHGGCTAVWREREREREGDGVRDDMQKLKRDRSTGKKHDNRQTHDGIEKCVNYFQGI